MSTMFRGAVSAPLPSDGFQVRPERGAVLLGNTQGQAEAAALLEKPGAEPEDGFKLARPSLTRLKTVPLEKCTIGKLCKDRDFPSQQFCGVIRHTERADASHFVESDQWHLTDDMQKWPLDPPLSDKGVVAAGEIGKQIRSLTQESGTKVHIVVSSPYLRCIQTAVEVCCALGSGTRLLVDCSLGEIFGPSTMGLMEPNPQCTVHPTEYILDLCRKRGVDCEPQFVGQWPSWPEHLRVARRRFAGRFLTYLRRSLRVRHNFLIVSHADCVGASLSVMPSEVGCTLEQVEYGGMFLAQRPLRPRSLSPDRVKRHRSLPECSLSPYRVRRHSSLPDVRTRIGGYKLEALQEGEQAQLPQLPDVPAFPFPAILDADSMGASCEEDSSNPWSQDPVAAKAHVDSAQFVSYHRSDTATSEVRAGSPPKASDGWQVQCFNIKRCSTQEKCATLERRLKDLLDDNVFSRRLIEQLLVTQLSALPLDRDVNSSGRDLRSGRTMEEQQGAKDQAEDQAFTRLISDCASVTNSTVLFGVAGDPDNRSPCTSWSLASFSPFPLSRQVTEESEPPTLQLQSTCNSRIAARRRSQQATAHKNRDLYATCFSELPTPFPCLPEYGESDL